MQMQIYDWMEKVTLCLVSIPQRFLSEMEIELFT